MYSAYLRILFAFLVVGFIIACTKDKEPTEGATNKVSLKTNVISSIGIDSAISGGEILSDGGDAISERGVCWGTTAEPTTSQNSVANGSGTGSYISVLRNLVPNTTYYVRAYIINAQGTIYADQLSFKTKAGPPTIQTNAVTSIKQISAVASGSNINDRGAAITRKGICWSQTNINPSLSDSVVFVGSGISNFSTTLLNLTPNSKYYVRAYATNANGTGYGNSVQFETLPAVLPTLTTNPITNIGQTTANGGGHISGDGGAPVTQRGLCWSTTSNPTIANSRTIDGSGTGSFTSSMAGLSPNQTYYVRAYATNAIGTTYGNLVSFTTSPLAMPSGVTTAILSSITQSTASGGGSISSDGGASITVRGVCWSNTTTMPNISNPRTINGTGVGGFTSSLTGLQPGTTYYVRAYATNSAGTSYGNTVSFTTSSAIPPSGITTYALSSITQNTATGGGSIGADGGAQITARGVCWSSSSTSPTIFSSRTIDGIGSGSYSSYLTGLQPGTTYYIRAYATNSAGTGYGNVVSFTTPQNLTVGMNYQGGIIAYIFVSGDAGYIAGQTHGLIATTTNQSIGATWGCSGISISTSISLGMGLTNTNAIVSNCGTTGIAARICNDLVVGGYSDWFLPSINELIKMYQNKSLIGGFSNGSYWSSSQYSTTAAYSLNFGAATYGTSGKNTSLYVRAIRKF